LQVPSRTTWAGIVWGNLFHAGMHEFPYLWYLFALVFWRLWSLLLAPLRPSVQILVAVSASALSGYADLSRVFKLDYALACFPIFVLGQVAGPEILLRTDQEYPRICSWCMAAIAAALLAAVFALQARPEGQAFQSDMPVAGWAHFVTDFCSTASIRLLWLRGLWKNVLELTKGLLFVACCPRGLGPLAYLGRHTLYPYLLHPAAMHWSDKFMHFLPAETHSAWRFAVAPLLLAAGLSAWPVRALLRVFLEPTWAEKYLAAREG